MSIKSFYDRYYALTDRKSVNLERNKTKAAELISLYKRREMYDRIQWSAEEQAAFDAYWKRYYGKTISNKWHRIYQSINGKYCVDYIPEMLYTTKIEYLFNDYRYAKVLADKGLIDMFGDISGCEVPETIALCSGGRFFNYKRQVISEKKMCEDIVARNHDVVIKPTCGSSSGKGIQFISAKKLNNIYQYVSRMGRDYVVQCAIRPDKVFASLNPSSINTLRVMTYILHDEIYHMPITCRMGSNESKVDNIHAGGLVIGVNDNGQLLDNAYQLGYGDKGNSYIKHPLTGIVFGDTVLPAIDKVIDVAYRVHSRLPRIGIVSWDFTVDEFENPVLIEANLTNQSIWFPQIAHAKGAFGSQTPQILEELQKLR